MKYEENLSAFQKLLLLRCFRVDRVYRAVTDYVTVTMGEKCVSIEIIQLKIYICMYCICIYCHCVYSIYTVYVYTALWCRLN